MVSMTLCRFLTRALNSLRAGEEGCSWVVVIVQTEAETDITKLRAVDKFTTVVLVVASSGDERSTVFDSNNRLNESELVSS